MNLEYDVVIIGSGPAGIMAAKTIVSNSDLRVLIIDKNGVFYDKPCGGGVPDECLTEFPFLAPMVTLHTTDIITKHENNSNMFPIGINMIARSHMRQEMLYQAFDSTRLNGQLDFLFNSMVVAVDTKKNNIIMSDNTKINYRMLIGADGVNSIVAKVLGYRIEKALIIVAHVDCSPETNTDMVSTIEFISGLRGYSWMFPKGRHVNIGIGGIASGKYLREAMDRILSERKILERPVLMFKEMYRSAHMIPMRYNMEQPPISPLDGIILCGDAATFVNPMTGEGIYFALKSGVEAAEIILNKRTPEQYPSFAPYLTQIQKMKNETDKIDIASAYQQIFCDPNESGKTVKFLFSHSIPERNKMSEREKKSIYESI